MNEALVRDFINAVKAENKKTSAYDTPATVTRVDGGTAWVHIPGGVDETPIKMTVNAKEGDTVQVRVADGRAWIVGNETAPPTDDAKANEADKKAAEAKYLAVDAVDAALKADIAAQDAVLSAETARAAAETAQEIAEGVEGIAEQAQQSAQSAYDSASTAITQLSVVEDIVGVLDLVANNGTYERTQDETPQPDKWYFTYNGTAYEVAVNPTFEYVLTQDSTIVQGKPYYTRSGSGTEQDPYVYTPVETPVQADIGTYYEYTNWYYYELTGIDQTIQNYVSSHLVLAGDSLFLQTDNGEGSTRLELNTTNGLTLYDQNGSPVAKYGTNTIIGNEDGFHVKIDGTEIGFYQQAQKVAYINGNKLYITQSVVLQQMDVGTPANEGGLGQWSWKVHEVDGQNNLYLKWLG